MPVGASAVQGMITDYTREINEIPNTYSRINGMGLFMPEPVATTTVTIDKVQNTLAILPEGPRGYPGTRAENKSGQTLTLAIPQIKHSDMLRPADIQDRRRPGDTGPDTRTRKTAQKLDQMRRKHMLTFEWMRMGAIKGEIVGGSGNVLYNLHDEFGLTRETVFFDLGNAGTDVSTKCRQLLRKVEDGVEDGGDGYGVRVFVSEEFFDDLIIHPSVKEAYLYYVAQNQAAAVAADRVMAAATGRQPLRDDMRRSFYHAGVTFEENRLKGTIVTPTSRTVTRGIAAGEGHAFPVGVPDMFPHYAAPADKMDEVNTEGALLYTWGYEDGKGNGIEFESESNPLPICKRPKALIKVSSAAS